MESSSKTALRYKDREWAGRFEASYGGIDRARFVLKPISFHPTQAYSSQSGLPLILWTPSVHNQRRREPNEGWIACAHPPGTF
jgi:hypothetical protein